MNDVLSSKRAVGMPWTGIGLLVVAFCVVLATPALAQQDASARVDPSPVEPGENVSLIFQISSPDTAEVVVQERVTCTVTFPDGTEREPCDRTAALAEVRTSGSGAQEYVFDYQAPSAEGSYEVLFEAESTARIQPATYRASAAFAVVEDSLEPQTDDPPTDGDPPDVDDGDPRGDEGTGDPSDGAGDPIASAGRPDTSRLMASTTLATGVLGVTIVANRFPLGGRQS